MANVSMFFLIDGVRADGALAVDVEVAGVAGIRDIGAVVRDGVPAVDSLHDTAHAEPGSALANGRTPDQTGREPSALAYI